MSVIIDATEKLTGAQVLLKGLEKSGIELLVGYTGGAIMPTFDTLPQFPKLRFITCRHEQGAGFIAQGYTRACGKLAPVLVTSGPGATNTITPVADAMMDSVPMLMITGQVATKFIGTDAFQETDVIGLMYPITKYAYMPMHADEVAKSLGQMLYLANHGRKGPVNLDIPKDVQNQLTHNIEIPEDLDLPGVAKVIEGKNLNLEQESKLVHQINQAIQLINSAKRPVALVGHGAILSECPNELREFLEKRQIPATFTLHGLSSLPASHELNLGMMGMHGEIAANRAIRDADLLIALGMRFDDRVTGKLEEYAQNAKVIHIEIDPSEIHKNVKAHSFIQADLKTALIRLNKLLEYTENPEWIYNINQDKILGDNYYQHIFEAGVGKNGKLLMSRIIHELSEFTQGQDNVVSDVGQNQMFTAKFYKFERFNTWFSSGGLGTMGFSLPAAIGVKLARPDQEVWSTCGDGGFQMNIQELGTILQEKIKINILVLNNNYLGMVRQWQEMFHKNRLVETQMIAPNLEYIAKAYDLGYRKIEKIEEIIPALKWSIEQSNTTILEFICEKHEMVLPMLPPGGSFNNIIENEAQAKEKLN